MPINQREKGANFERDLCKLLGDWWQCVFKRTTMLEGQTKHNLFGDLVPVNNRRWWPFCVELKAQEFWNIEITIYNPETSELSRMLQQAWLEAERINEGKKSADTLIPMLIVKHNRCQPLVMLPCYKINQDQIFPRAQLLFTINGDYHWAEVYLLREFVETDPDQILRRGL